MVDQETTEKVQKETAETPETADLKNGAEWNAVPVILILVPLLVVSCSLVYVYLSFQANEDNNTILVVDETPPEHTEPSLLLPPPPSQPSPSPSQPSSANATTWRKAFQAQPSCSLEEHIQETMRNIFAELQLRRLSREVEEEDHQVSSKTPAEPRGHFVIYIAVGLLLASLAAALVDVYRAKGKTGKAKPQLTKRCSLADLTVLRHSRRESMRRDSVADEHRVPLKLLGARPSLPDHRRCSFPIYPGDFSYAYVSPRQGWRRGSLDYCEEVYAIDEFHHNRVRLIRRF